MINSDKKPVLPFLEIMPIQACNLSCVGCSNYSDIAHKGYLTWQQGYEQIAPWTERVELPDFGIIGGEPLMNPAIIEWIVGIRKLLPNSQIRFTTNGLLLHKFPDLLKLFMEIGNCTFKITVHVHDLELQNCIDKIFRDYDWKPITEYGIDRFIAGNNVRFHVKKPDIFYKSYQRTYNNMMPHHSEPAEAFDICYQQTCPLLYNGKIYKCSSNGLLQDTLKMFDNPNFNEWQPYFDEGISSNCSDIQLEKFIENFGKPHSMCGMCPSQKHTNSRILHYNNVSRKKIIL
jgi:organic radical activating enzyme